MSRSSVCRFVGLLFLLTMATPAFAQETWSGALGNGAWNSSGNWSPAGVPGARTDVIFDDSGGASPVISILGTDASSASLSFISGSVNYSLNSTGTSLTTSHITRALTTGSAADTISLDTTKKTGSLVFPGASLLIDNEASPTDPNSPTLIISSPTTIGSLTGAGNLSFTGTGTTVFSGGFAIVGSLVTGGLTKTGTGTLVLAGNTSALSGTINVAGGTLRLDYSSITSSKLGAGSSSANGSLALSGGNLVLQSNASTAINQSVSGTGATVLNPGQSNISLSTNNGALAALALDLHAISRPVAGGTLDIDVSQALTSVATTNTNVNGILSPWMTVNNGATWGTISTGHIVPFTAYTNGIGGNSDISSLYHTGETDEINSLRLSGPSPQLVCSNPLLIQSGGILVTKNTSAIISGEAIQSTAEIVVQAHGDLVIDSNVQAFNGFTKTGAGSLLLTGGVSVTGPFNINQGSVQFSNASFGANTMNLNDRSGNIQNVIFTLPQSSSFNSPLNIQLGANNQLSNQTNDSRIGFSGVMSSLPGFNTPLRLLSFTSGGFNLNNSSNTFVGTVNVAGGFLGIAANGSLGDPSNILMLGTGASGGGLEFLSDGVTLTHQIALTSSSRILVDAGNSAEISSTISGGGTLIKDSGGTLTLSGANSYAGGVQVNAGTLRVASASNLGTPPSVAVNAGTLAVTGTINLPAGCFLEIGPTNNGAVPTIDVQAGQTLTVAGPVLNAGGNGALLKTGFGTLALTATPGQSNYIGGITVMQGTLQTVSDTNLGTAPITVGPLGTLAYTNTSISSRLFTLNNGTMSIADSKMLALNGAIVAGGFLTGPGAYNLSGGSFLTAVNFTRSAIVAQTGPATIQNSTNNAQFTNLAGRTLNWNNNVNTSAGQLLITGTVNSMDLLSDGQIHLFSGGVLDNTGSAGSIVLGGGSRTTIDSGATLKAGGTSIEVNGGLIINNGTISGTTNVHFNGEVVGSGNFGVVNVFENGRFSPGASASPAVFSPGVAVAVQASFESSSSLAVEIGGANAGNGYDRLAVIGPAKLAGTLEIATANSFVPAPLEEFRIVTSLQRTGIFTHYTGVTAPNGLAYAPRYDADGVTLVATLFGDANFDGKVDFADLVALAQNYGTDVADTTDNWWMHGDFNLNGSVDFEDLVKVAQNYGLSLQASPAQATTVPEPTAVMIGLSALLLCCRRRAWGL